MFKNKKKTDIELTMPELLFYITLWLIKTHR